MDHLQQNAFINRLCITKLAVTYRKVIAHNLLCIISYRLVHLESITVSTNHVCRIIIPLSLRCVVFNSIHASPAAGHMGEYKTLYRLKLRIFWPCIRTDIKIKYKLNIYFNFALFIGL